MSALVYIAPRYLLALVFLIMCWPTLVGARECVVLLHGLGRTEQSMKKIETTLLDAHYAVWNQSYQSTRSDIQSLAAQAISPAEEYCRQFDATHFVTHSLGGILVRAWLQGKSFNGRIIMLSPPNSGSEIPDVLEEYRLFHKLLGPAVAQLGTKPDSFPNSLNPVPGEIGVITGDRSADPWFSWLIPGPDDGKVSVESAKLEEMTDFAVVPYGHTFIMRKQEVLDQILYFLKNGLFKEK